MKKQQKNLHLQKQKKIININETRGKIEHCIIEPFIPHNKNKELYLSINTEKEKDIIFFSTNGGIDIEDEWDNSIVKIEIPTGKTILSTQLKKNLPPTLI